MKQNGNDRITGEYYLGLDVGTNSVGWAVTDKDYQLLRCRGNAMWGARLFDESQDASARRTNRTNRRRLARRHQRLLLLDMLFEEEIRKVDPGFLLRMRESSFWLDDKTDKTCRFALFNDPGFTDKDYHRRYPTVYHLRKELMASRKPHDVRLVYLALHHIMKSRGHFLYDLGEGSEELHTLSDALSDLRQYLASEYGIDFAPADPEAFSAALIRDDLGITGKKKLLRAAWGGADGEEPLSLSTAVDMLSGASVSLAALFADESLAKAEVSKLSLKSDLEEQFDLLSDELGERLELLFRLKDVFDTARLSRMLHGAATISEAKVELYEKNRRDLRTLKAYVRACAPEKYKEIFSAKKEKLNNYAAYSGYMLRSGAHSCTQEEFCKYLKGVLPEPAPGDDAMQAVMAEIREGTFLTRLKGSDNGVIPYQLQRRELRRILENAAAYLPFLDRMDPDGYTVRQKIEMTFEFRIPYYVGPLNKNAGNHWAVRFAGKEGEKIFPWNFKDVIDTEASAGAFIEELIGLCSYTGEKVLPRDSLLYSEYMLLNELNPLRVNGQALPADVKKELIRDLFEDSRRKVTKKRIRDYLLCKGRIQAGDEITGIDDTIKTVLRSYHDFRSILEKTGDRAMVERIIRQLLIFGEDRAMMKKWLRKNTHGLDENDIASVCRLKYTEWGRLSEYFLTGIWSEDPAEGTGEAHNIMDMLRSTDRNLMQLLTDQYRFAAQAEEHRREVLGVGQTLTDRLDSLYIAPAVRRSIRQTLRIVDEIVDIRKSVPEKIFIEMARDSAGEMKGRRTESRKTKLLDLYARCREEGGTLLPRLEKEDDNTLRSDKLYLYYTQFGKCMYSGEPIDLDALMTGHGFDIDHIFPRSRIKDNSLDNRVVVKNTLNREKTNDYPIKGEIRTRMKPFWAMLKEKGMISEKKYDRLIRSTPLTEAELSSFVARQLVETQQSTKALTAILRETYGDAARIVFSKAGNVSDFRHDFDMLKCREVNDFHHAKDAYLNIVVGNVYDTRFTKRFFENIRSEEYSLNRVFDWNVPGAWDKTETIKTVKKVMAKNNPIITRMPREVKGQLFDLQLMSAGKGQLEKKRGLPIEKYGGYNKISGAFYCVAEHTEKKKRVRTIEPVYVYCRARYEQDPAAYCREILGLADPRVICREIRADALLELDGKRLYISGRTGSYYVCEHAYQLAIDDERQKYIRNAIKYIERCNARREELPITAFDGLDMERNLDLYEYFQKKLSSNVYSGILGNMQKDLTDSKEVFKGKTVKEQVEILMEILKAFRCNPQYANLKELCNKGTVGRILQHKRISDCQEAVLVHQSVTGLYEVREDLLG